MKQREKADPPRSVASREITGEETPLRTWLEKHGITQEQLARRMERSLGTISLWTRGKVRPPDDGKYQLKEVTLAIESELGVKKPRGVLPGDWYGKGGAA